MKGVIYARYSSDNQREESIEGQLRECKEYAERNDITILGTYIDRALSAKTDNRPEFQHMIKESAKGLFDVVLVWKLDRFARNRYDSARYKNLLKKNGVKVISARENISEGSEGIILEAMLEGYAEYYSAELSEKVIRGLTDNALKCKYNGGTVPMGYYIDEQQYYQIDPKTAPVVLEMFTKYSEGATMQELVNLLNSRGMRSIRGGKITLNIMNHLLKNRRYMGEYSYRDVVKENGIPAIVPKELFERVQERLAKNKKAPARHKAEDDYLLTTKLYCGKCGSFMVGESGTSHTMKVHRYYRCVNTKKKKLCDKKAVKKDWIEDLVVNYTMKAIMNDEVMERLIDTLMELQKKESTDLPLLKKQLAETEKGINNMLNAIQAGIFTPSTKQRLDELEETKSQLEVSILQEEMHKPLLTREQIAFFIYRFRKFDVTKREQRQRLIDSFVNAVYLYEDKIILTFNYKDGSKTITLAEVEGSDLSVLGAPKEMTEVYPLRGGGVPRSFLFFGCLCRYHTVLVGADGVCIDGVALGGVGQDAKGVAGVQDAAGLLGTPAHLVDVGLLNDLHVGDFIGKVAPVGLQMNDGAELRRTKVREVRARMPADKDCAVLAGQDAVTLGAAARTAAKLTLAVAPIEGAVHVCAFDPDAAQLFAVLHAVVLGLRSGDLLGTLRGGCFGGPAFFLLTGCLGGFTGGAGSLLLGGFGGGLTGCSGTGRSGSFGSSLPVFGDDQRRRYADADGQRQCAEGQALCHPFAAHALCSRLAR